MPHRDRLQHALQSATQQLEAARNMLSILGECTISEDQSAIVDRVADLIHSAEASVAQVSLLSQQTQTIVNISHTKPHVLIVSRDAVQRMWLSQTVVKSGYRVTGAVDSDEMATAFQSDAFDVLVLDCSITGGEALHAASVYQRLVIENGIRRVPIIGYSTHCDPPFKARCAEFGIVDFLKKPATQGQCIECLDRVARLRKSSGQSASL